MTSFYVFIIMLLSFFCQLINSQLISTTSILNNTETTTRGNVTDQTTISTILVFNMTTINSSNTTIKPNETTTTISTTTVSTNITSMNKSTTAALDTNRPSESSSKSRSWLLFAPLFTVTVVIGIGIIHYYRQHTPYRRFLRNWRSRDDETDNIILQLEQPDIINGQWPPRISFA